MNISGVKKKGDWTAVEEQIVPDPFMLLAEFESGVATARVSSTVGRSIEYGDVKCSFTVSITCPQDGKCIERAAELCFSTALQFTNDGMSHLAPGLPAIEYTKE